MQFSKNYLFCKLTEVVTSFPKLSPEGLRPADFKRALKIFSNSPSVFPRVEMGLKLTGCISGIFAYFLLKKFIKTILYMCPMTQKDSQG